MICIGKLETNRFAFSGARFFEITIGHGKRVLVGTLDGSLNTVSATVAEAISRFGVQRIAVLGSCSAASPMELGDFAVCSTVLDRKGQAYDVDHVLSAKIHNRLEELVSEIPWKTWRPACRISSFIPDREVAAVRDGQTVCFDPMIVEIVGGCARLGGSIACVKVASSIDNNGRLFCDLTGRGGISRSILATAVMRTAEEVD